MNDMPEKEDGGGPLAEEDEDWWANDPRSCEPCERTATCGCSTFGLECDCCAGAPDTVKDALREVETLIKRFPKKQNKTKKK